MALLRRDQVPFAMSLTLNRLAKKTIQEEQEEIKRVFDRPTPFTVRALRQPREAKATKKKLDTFIWFKTLGKRGDAVENTLRPHIEGGGRNVKSSEKRMRRIGAIAPNEWMISAIAAPRNKYGNVRVGIYKNMLEWFRGYTEGGYNVGTGRQGVRYEIVPEGRGRMIYEVSTTKRGKDRYRPRFFLTKRAPRYRRRFDLYGVADRSHTKHGPAIADRAMVEALRTAR